MLNILKLVIIMYMRSWAVMVTNVPPKRIFKASHRFYLFLLLVMLFLCMLAVGYAAVEWVQCTERCAISWFFLFHCCNIVGLSTFKLPLKNSLSGWLFNKHETIYRNPRSASKLYFACFAAVLVKIRLAQNVLNMLQVCILSSAESSPQSGVVLSGLES